MPDIEEVLFLLMKSELHRKWCISDIKRLILPPVRLGQFGLLREDGKPVGVFTFGWFSKEASDGYESQTRKLQPEDWYSGKELWVIDFIAPFGHAKEMFRHFKKYDFLHDAKFRRSHSRNKIRVKGKILRNAKQ